MTQPPPSNFSEDPLTDPVQETNDDSSSELIEAIAPSPEELISTKKVPISLVVEVGKIQITLDKLLKLKPGNIIDLSVQPEFSVNLVANNSPVARGQLIQIGDVIGVKITEIS